MGADIGYGQQTALFAPRLAQHYQLTISAFYGLEGAPLGWKGLPVLPGLGNDWGDNSILPHAKRTFGILRGGLVFTLMDEWVMSCDMASKVQMACWTPVDHEPPIARKIKFFQVSGAVPVAMSRFGEEQLRGCGFDPLYVPHGVDTQIYRPHDRAAVRQEVGIPADAFVIGQVAANKGRPSRKGFQQSLEAFRIFHDSHPEAMMYLHTVASPDVANGEDIYALTEMLGINDAVMVADAVKMLHDPYPPEAMAKIYSTFDCLANPSMGEGFGVPILEAAACGVPAVVTNFSSMPEVAGDAGWKVGCRPFWTPGNAWMAIADVEEIVEAYEQCYSQTETERQARSDLAREHALAYDADRVTEEYFLPVLDQVFERFGEREPEVVRTDLAAVGT